MEGEDSEEGKGRKVEGGREYVLCPGKKKKKLGAYGMNETSRA